MDTFFMNRIICICAIMGSVTVQNLCIIKLTGTRKISAKKKRPKTTTAPCQRLIASTSLEIAIEFVAMYFLLLLVESAYEQTAQPKFVCTGENRFPFVSQSACCLSHVH